MAEEKYVRMYATKLKASVVLPFSFQNGGLSQCIKFKTYNKIYTELMHRNRAQYGFKAYKK